MTPEPSALQQRATPAAQEARAVYWPPLTSLDNIDRAIASLSWHFGDHFDMIYVPVKTHSLPEIHVDTAIIGSHSLANIPKIKLCTTDSESFSDAIKRDHVRLVWQSPLSKAEEFAGRPMKGSRRVEGIHPDEAGTFYYFCGDAQKDSEEAFLRATFLYWQSLNDHDRLIDQSRLRLQKLKEFVSSVDRVNLFGTGPSIVEAADADFSGEINLVCNSIIRDREWIRRNTPTIIFATDAHFHFSYHTYTEHFYCDLLFAMKNNPLCHFITFDKFAILFITKFPELASRVIALPSGRKQYGYDLDKDFSLAPADSVLNMFMLPVACHLASQVNLYGFTGRSKNDSYFWSHSTQFQYTDQMQSVRTAHPQFFQRDFTAYSDKVEDDLALRINSARSAGIKFSSRTTTYYSALQDL